MDEFYLQDSRGYVGNDVLWWAKDCRGYTTNLSQAHVFSRREAQIQHDSRHTDIPWPKAYIDAKARPAVDCQYIERQEAHADSGITLRPIIQWLDPVTPRCAGCGRFMSEAEFWSGACSHCCTDNRP